MIPENLIVTCKRWLSDDDITYHSVIITDVTSDKYLYLTGREGGGEKCLETAREFLEREGILPTLEDIPTFVLFKSYEMLVTIIDVKTRREL